jgi:hypothetical protein
VQPAGWPCAGTMPRSADARIAAPRMHRRRDRTVVMTVSPGARGPLRGGRGRAPKFGSAPVRPSRAGRLRRPRNGSDGF